MPCKGLHLHPRARVAKQGAQPGAGHGIAWQGTLCRLASEALGLGGAWVAKQGAKPSTPRAGAGFRFHLTQHPGPTSTPRAPTNPGPGWAKPYRSACFARAGFRRGTASLASLGPAQSAGPSEAVGLCPTSTFPSTQAQPALVPAPHCYPRF